MITSINKPIDPADPADARDRFAIPPPRYPAPDDRRCDAIAKPSQHPLYDWEREFHRCRLFATWWRDGRQVCTHHFRSPTIKYTPGCGDRVGAYRDAMARALGDEP
jgi:hypothetical protein